MTAQRLGEPTELFILDTNILVDLLWGKAGFQPGEDWGAYVRKAIKWMLETQHVMVPHITLVEFAGKFFQESIDVSNYPEWHRNRMVAFTPLLATLFNPATSVQLHTAPTRIEALDHSIKPLSRFVIDDLGSAYRSKPQHRRGKRDPKALDGVDAQILDEATVIAMSKPSTHCWLVTADRGLQAVVEDVRQRAETDSRLPRNLQAMSGQDLAKRHRECGLKGGIS